MRRSPIQGTALAVAAKARDVMKVHHVLVDPNEKITQKTVQTVGIATTGQWGPWEACLQVKEKRQAVQWFDGPDKTGCNGVGDEDFGVKPGEDEPVGRKGAVSL